MIYLIVFIAAFLSFNLLITFLVEKWRGWQSKQMDKLARRLDNSLISLEKKKRLLATSSPFLFGFLGFLITSNLLVSGAGVIIGLSLPVLLSKMAKQARIRKFQSQLVACLMILSSSLRGGLSFVQALAVLCEEMPAPAAEEFSFVLKENKLGVTLDDSLMSLRKRMPLEEVNLMVSSILVAKGTGGELTRVFSRLTETIRSNIKLKEKISTLTLQGRLQGIIMALLPVAFAIFIYKQDSHHFDVMLETQLGKTLLIAAVAAQLIGMYLIKRISTLRI